MTDAPPPEPKILSWIPEVAPERARRLRMGVLGLLLGSSGLFSAGLLTGVWSVSQGYPDFDVLRGHAQVRQAQTLTRDLLDRHPARLEVSDEAMADRMDADFDRLHHQHILPLLHRLHRMPLIGAEVKAIENAESSFYDLRMNARLYKLLDQKQGRPSTPAEQLVAAGKDLAVLQERLDALDRKLKAVYPWLKD